MLLLLLLFVSRFSKAAARGGHRPASARGRHALQLKVGRQRSWPDWSASAPPPAREGLLGAPERGEALRVPVSECVPDGLEKRQLRISYRLAFD